MISPVLPDDRVKLNYVEYGDVHGLFGTNRKNSPVTWLKTDKEKQAARTINQFKRIVPAAVFAYIRKVIYGRPKTGSGK